MIYCSFSCVGIQYTPLHKTFAGRVNNVHPRQSDNDNSTHFNILDRLILLKTSKLSCYTQDREKIFLYG